MPDPGAGTRDSCWLVAAPATKAEAPNRKQQKPVEKREPRLGRGGRGSRRAGFQGDSRTQRLSRSFALPFFNGLLAHIFSQVRQPEAHARTGVGVVSRARFGVAIPKRLVVKAIDPGGLVPPVKTSLLLSGNVEESMLCPSPRRSVVRGRDRVCLRRTGYTPGRRPCLEHVFGIARGPLGLGGL